MIPKVTCSCSSHLSIFRPSNLFVFWACLDWGRKEGEWRGVEGSRIEFVENRLILSQFYSTLLYSYSLSQSKQTISVNKGQYRLIDFMPCDSKDNIINTTKTLMVYCEVGNFWHKPFCVSTSLCWEVHHGDMKRMKWAFHPWFIEEKRPFI